MFKRRNPRSFLLKLREVLWPRTGWSRFFKYIWFRLHRIPGSRNAIAAGFACGAAVSFMPLNGLHFFLAAFLAWAMRGNLLASAIGTAVGNPWTFPPIWVATYWLGNMMLGQGTASHGHELDFGQLFSALWRGVRDFDGALLAEKVWPVWWPMFVGSLPVTLIMWFAFYIPLRRALDKFQHLRAARRLNRLGERAKNLARHSGDGEAGGQRS